MRILANENVAVVTVDRIRMRPLPAYAAGE
jgi:hypothetical protein